MPNQENLVEIMGKLGQPPEGVDIETYAIAKVDPTELNRVAREVTPTYAELIRIRDNHPEFYTFIIEEPQPELRLGNGIFLKQQRLSRTRRSIATTLAALTFASGMGAVTYNAKEQYRKDVPGVVSKKNQLLTTAATGGIAGLTGGIIAQFGGLFFTHRLARKPAQKIVSRAEQGSL